MRETNQAAAARPAMTHAAVNEYLDLAASGLTDPAVELQPLCGWINRWGGAEDKQHLMDLRNWLAVEQVQPARDERFIFVIHEILRALAIDVLTRYAAVEQDWRAA
ncbi:MAG TPA: hypothetical protein VFL91_21335 [Thermomicrobiales bacterium]|nr:hypothetical protein [Thermomicrobiales bacterium]